MRARNVRMFGFKKLQFSIDLMISVNNIKKFTFSENRQIASNPKVYNTPWLCENWQCNTILLYIISEIQTKWMRKDCFAKWITDVVIDFTWNVFSHTTLSVIWWCCQQNIYLPRVQCQDTTINLSPLFSGSAQASLKLCFVSGLNLADMICEDVIVLDIESYYEF